jgi:hypothetical protein
MYNSITPVLESMSDRSILLAPSSTIFYHTPRIDTSSSMSRPDPVVVLPSLELELQVRIPSNVEDLPPGHGRGE